MTTCTDCLYFKHRNKDNTGLCTVHKHVALPPYLEHHINIVNTTDTCGLAKPPEFVL